MLYGNIKYVKNPVSRIIFGTSTKVFERGEDENALLDAVLSSGINTFDTARVYGKAEETLGRWLSARGNRDKVVLLSKGGHPSPLGFRRVNEREIIKDLQTSLKALGTDHIDIYLLHRDDRRKPAGEAVEILNALHAAGKIGAFGGSNWSDRRIEEANEYAYRKGLIPFTVSSPYFGLADMKGDPFFNGAVSVAGPSHAEARAWYQRTGMPLVAYSVLGRGFFSGRAQKRSDLKDGWVKRAFWSKENLERLRRVRELAQKKGCSPARIALAWMLLQDLNGFAVVSATSEKNLKDDLSALELKLSQEELGYLDLK